VVEGWGPSGYHAATGAGATATWGHRASFSILVLQELALAIFGRPPHLRAVVQVLQLKLPSSKRRRRLSQSGSRWHLLLHLPTILEPQDHQRLRAESKQSFAKNTTRQRVVRLGRDARSPTVNTSWAPSPSRTRCTKQFSASSSRRRNTVRGEPSATSRTALMS